MRLRQLLFKNHGEKIWPSMKQQAEPPESSVTVEMEIVQDLQALQWDIQPADVEVWLAEGDFTKITDEELDDDQIISAVLQADAEEDNTDEDKGDTAGISPSAAKEAFKLALKYTEKHPTATPMEIMWAKKWRDASKK
ncbi:hypothetical protein PR048_004727 [Dryococelus australis]|uniref:Tail assembly chaperone n=1 Tax=Dryococelus australis TaxID=614101 RepID=A0ABQ9I6L8_9NEOP|nr:hypothetical protein PR048_004727 [Dryococelus australis]